MIEKTFSFKYDHSDLKKLATHPSLNIIASIGKITILIFICTDQLYLYRQITDENLDEDFYCCCFKDNYLLVAGKLGVLKMINIFTLKIEILSYHGSSINDLVVRDDWIFACSSDGTIGVYKDRLMYLFIGHEDVVLSLDISLCGRYLVSSGTDCMIKVWDLEILNSNYKDKIFDNYKNSGDDKLDKVNDLNNEKNNNINNEKNNIIENEPEIEIIKPCHICAKSKLNPVSKKVKTNVKKRKSEICYYKHSIDWQKTIKNFGIGSIIDDDVKIIQKTIFSSQYLHSRYIKHVSFSGKFIVSSSRKKILVVYPFYNIAKEPLFVKEIKYVDDIIFKCYDNIFVAHGQYIEILGREKFTFDHKIRDFCVKKRLYVLYEGSRIDVFKI
ncbi:Polycomb protein eed-A [Dictyocoela muelleri]|nr:Polycomb protein eed-A [Dictyocoela muelleri]